MERTVPIRSSEEIELYLRTIYSLLRSTNEVQIRSLELVHARMNSSLHTLAGAETPDFSALIYTLLRLPDCITSVNKVILGQSLESFALNGFGAVETWQEVAAKARRRRCFFDGSSQLACYIASRSDIDDVIPSLTALQIEWNKLHHLLNTAQADLLKKVAAGKHHALSELAAVLLVSEDDLQRLQTVLGGRFINILEMIASRESDFKVQLLNGSLNDYRKATQTWWRNVEEHYPEINGRPIYFVSSNTHSITNLLSGYAVAQKDNILAYLAREEPQLMAEWEALSQEPEPNQANFFYYTLKKFQAAMPGDSAWADQYQFEQQRGIRRVASTHAFDIEANIIDLAALDPNTIDPRIAPCPSRDCGQWDFLSKTDALILNIDYPLGFAAYNLLAKIAENTRQILGIYVMGKAASLNGGRGDVIIPNVVYDEHSKNTFLFDNHFSARDVSPFLSYGTVLDNQKSVSVLGTFLQNSTIMDVIYREGYTDIEMEAGPYLSAVFEMYRPQRNPVNEIVNLYKVPFDLGILHYVSDTPYSTGHNLGKGTLSYYGVDPTYAVSLSILRRIMDLEMQRVTAG